MFTTLKECFYNEPMKIILPHGMQNKDFNGDKLQNTHMLGYIPLQKASFFFPAKAGCQMLNNLIC